MALQYKSCTHNTRANYEPESQSFPGSVHSGPVLLGGGHGHLFVLRHLSMNPLPGLRVSLMPRCLQTPYSLMLPGLTGGIYQFDEAHIDLLPLAHFAGARVITPKRESSRAIRQGSRDWGPRLVTA